MVEITMVKNATINGKKLVKDTILEVTEENANKLIEDGKAKLTQTIKFKILNYWIAPAHIFIPTLLASPCIVLSIIASSLYFSV